MYQFTDDFNFASGDLCNPNPCGVDADCKPGSDRSGNDRPVCFCRAGYLGDPLVSCRRGQCIDHAVIQPFIDKIPKQQNFKITFFLQDCSANQACYGYQCVDPCTSTTSRSVCGIGARCDARNHGAVCSCPIGYDGDPLSECRVSFNRG